MDERCRPGQRIDRRVAPGAPQSLRSLEGKPIHEHRNTLEELLLGEGEQAETPGNGGAHGLLACRTVGCATGERRKEAV